jgi:hypothetical protein
MCRRAVLELRKIRLWRMLTRRNLSEHPGWRAAW